ncbi:MAG: hypothetical protein V4722_19395 [Bacteroidota bacterium]
MATTIEIKKELIPDVITMFSLKAKEAKAEIKRLEGEVKDYYATISQLHKALTDGDVEKEIKPPPIPYNVEWRWQDKIRFALGQLSKPSSTREIVDYLANYEPHFAGDDSKKAIGSVSAILSAKSGTEDENKFFVRSTRNNNELVYTNSIDVVQIFSDDDSDKETEAILYGTTVTTTKEPVDDMPF